MNIDRLNLEQFDDVILVESSIDEAKAAKYATTVIDPRLKTKGYIVPDEYINRITTVGAGAPVSYGTMIRNYIPQGNGYSSEIVDFGEAITVKITHTNIKTAKSSSQNFIILFSDINNGSCVVKSSFARWKTCNSPEQAANYIRSKASSLAGKTSNFN